MTGLEQRQTWKQKIVKLKTLSSLVAPSVVNTTTYCVTSDNKGCQIDDLFVFRDTAWTASLKMGVVVMPTWLLLTASEAVDMTTSITTNEKKLASW